MVGLQDFALGKKKHFLFNWASLCWIEVRTSIFHLMQNLVPLHNLPFAICILIKRTTDLMIMALLLLPWLCPAITRQGKQRKILPVPNTTPGSREAIVDKMPCLGAYARGGLKPPTLWLWGESTRHYIAETLVFQVSLHFCYIILYQAPEESQSILRLIQNWQLISIITLWQAKKKNEIKYRAHCNDVTNSKLHQIFTKQFRLIH